MEFILGIKYCDETTLHGYRYLTKPGIFNQVIWLLVITSCSISAVYFGLYENFSAFLEACILVISCNNLNINEVYLLAKTSDHYC